MSTACLHDFTNLKGFAISKALKEEARIGNEIRFGVLQYFQCASTALRYNRKPWVECFSIDSNPFREKGSPRVFTRGQRSMPACTRRREYVWHNAGRGDRRKGRNSLTVHSKSWVTLCRSWCNLDSRDFFWVSLIEGEREKRERVRDGAVVRVATSIMLKETFTCISFEYFFKALHTN